VPQQLIAVWLSAAGLFLGSLGAMVLARSGVIYTAVTAHFILTAIVYAYAGALSFIFGLLAALAVGIVIVVLSFLVNQFNRITYIAVLYAFSLMSMPLAGLVLREFRTASTGDSLVSPRVAWPLTQEWTIALATLLSIGAAVVVQALRRTRGSVLLRHWAQSSPAVVRDLERAQVLSTARILRAASPRIILATFCFLAAVVFLWFAQEKAYLSGRFDVLPFWMLLIGLAANDRVSVVATLVVLFALANTWIGQFLRSTVSAVPTPSIYLFYGVLFLTFTVIGASREQRILRRRPR
jgi:hypothetical protein